MNTARFAMPACAVLALALAGCSAERGNQEEPSAERDVTASSPTTMPTSATNEGQNIRTPPATVPPQIPAIAAGPEDPLSSIGADTGQAQALASCRALIDARRGTPSRPDADAVARAARDLATDPNALGACQAEM